jgi:hypothetical protein
LITIGIDPGARYTAVVVREYDDVLLASTYVRPQDMAPVTWATNVVEMIQRDIIPLYPDAYIGIEGISSPKGYQNGKLAPINPKDIIKAGMVLGTLALAFKPVGAVIVPPKKNGSTGEYPECLNGRRPKDLAGSSVGAGTRNHEKSAYDVAGKVMFLRNDGFILDERTEIV